MGSAGERAVDPELISDTVREALRAHVFTVLTTLGPLAAFRPQPSRRALYGPIALTAAGGSGPDFNYALAFGPADPEALFTRAAEFFGPAEQYAVVVEAETAQAVEDELRRRGWQLDEEEPALVLPALPDPLPPPPDGLMIRRVADERTLEDFRAITGSRWIPSVEAATAPHVAVLVGYRDETPVAASRVARHGYVADITGVQTLPEYRRRGYGTAMTWAAIDAARAMGCTAFELTATELGYPVYRRMGFIPVCTLRTYLPPRLDARL